jgi:hypothetical protein
LWVAVATFRDGVLLRKALTAVRAAEKFDPSLVDLFPGLIDYFANSKPGEDALPTGLSRVNSPDQALRHEQLAGQLKLTALLTKPGQTTSAYNGHGLIAMGPISPIAIDRPRR